jgi:hypothetical protein
MRVILMLAHVSIHAPRAGVFRPQLGIDFDQHMVGGLSLAGMTRDRVAALP